MFWLEKLGIEQKWLTLTNLVLTDSNLLLFAIILLLNKKKAYKTNRKKKVYLLWDLYISLCERISVRIIFNIQFHSPSSKCSVRQRLQLNCLFTIKNYTKNIWVYSIPLYSVRISKNKHLPTKKITIQTMKFQS